MYIVTRVICVHVSLGCIQSQGQPGPCSDIRCDRNCLKNLLEQIIIYQFRIDQWNTTKSKRKISSPQKELRDIHSKRQHKGPCVFLCWSLGLLKWNWGTHRVLYLVLKLVWSNRSHPKRSKGQFILSQVYVAMTWEHRFMWPWMFYSTKEVKGFFFL